MNNLNFTSCQTGKVYLVGAGPGDPGLITVRGARLIAEADVIIYDFLASPVLLKMAMPEAEMIYVGKKGGDHTLTQDKINELIVEKAKTGAKVVRLKGGDPFIFGRGGEEVETLIKAGIFFEIVPGVTSAIAAPAYAGIPLTHRDYTSTVAFVTGHENPEKTESSIDWTSLARGIGTIVFLMGVKNLPNIVRELIANGRSPETPTAVVRWGTTRKQVTVSAPLNRIVDTVEKAGIKAPAAIIVGEVVSLRNTMKWFEKRPLFNRQIVVTRARSQASDLVSLLSDAGADCLEIPVIKIVPAKDLSPLDTALKQIETYEWLVFTSVNGVKIFFNYLFDTNRDLRDLSRIKTACIGPATAETLFSFGLRCDILPESYRAESVVDAFKHIDLENKRFLLPRAAEARPVLPVELEKMGAVVDEIPIYNTIPQNDGMETLRENLTAKTVDMVTFTSSSTVKNFYSLLPEEPELRKKLMEVVKVAAIGPITADTAKEHGFDVHLEAKEYTIPGLYDAIVKYYACS